MKTRENNLLPGTPFLQQHTNLVYRHGNFPDFSSLYKSIGKYTFFRKFQAFLATHVLMPERLCFSYMYGSRAYLRNTAGLMNENVNF